MVKINEFEFCKFLENHGRMAAAKMAKEFGVTETAVRKKMMKLQKKGVILGYYTKINWEKLIGE